MNSTEGLLLSNASGVIGDGVTKVKVLFQSGSDPVAALVVRAQDQYYYYAVKIKQNQLIITRKYPWTETTLSTGNMPTAATNVWHDLRVTTIGGTITVYWNDTQIISYTDGSPLTSGKVGFRQATTGRMIWDDMSVVSGSLGTVVAYDDYDPWGMILEGRSYNGGTAEWRYRFTEKERDVETGYDYFGERLYDARIARWLAVDPSADGTPAWTPYRYAFNNPLSFVDPDGRDEKQREALVQKAKDLADLKIKRGTDMPELKVNGNTATKMDCAAFVRVIAIQMGFPEPGSFMYAGGLKGANGVTQVAGFGLYQNSRGYGFDEIQRGMIVVVRSTLGGLPFQHVLVATEVTRGEDGRVVDFDFAHCSGRETSPGVYKGETTEDSWSTYTKNNREAEFTGAYDITTPSSNNGSAPTVDKGGMIVKKDGKFSFKELE